MFGERQGGWWQGHLGVAAVALWPIVRGCNAMVASPLSVIALVVIVPSRRWFAPAHAVCSSLDVSGVGGARGGSISVLT